MRSLLTGAVLAVCLALTACQPITQAAPPARTTHAAPPPVTSSTVATPVPATLPVTSSVPPVTTTTSAVALPTTTLPTSASVTSSTIPTLGPAYDVQGTQTEPGGIGAGDYTWRTVSCDPGDVATGVGRLVFIQTLNGGPEDASDNITTEGFTPDPNALQTGYAKVHSSQSLGGPLTITYRLRCQDNAPVHVP